MATQASNQALQTGYDTMTEALVKTSKDNAKMIEAQSEAAKTAADAYIAVVGAMVAAEEKRFSQWCTIQEKKHELTMKQYNDKLAAAKTKADMDHTKRMQDLEGARQKCKDENDFKEQERIIRKKQEEDAANARERMLNIEKDHQEKMQDLELAKNEKQLEMELNKADKMAELKVKEVQQAHQHLHTEFNVQVRLYDQQLKDARDEIQKAITNRKSYNLSYDPPKIANGRVVPGTVSYHIR